MYNEIIKFVSTRKEVDKYGDMKEIKTYREVFAELKSIGQSEFYQANADGFKPEIKFIIADYYDYQKEKTLLFKDYCDIDFVEYKIIRTFRNGNTLEIVCERGVD